VILNGHFTLNFCYFETGFQQFSYIYIVEPNYRTFLLYDVTSRCAEADRDPQNTADPRKDCGSVVDEKLRTLHRRNLNKFDKNNIISTIFSALWPFH